MNTYTEDQLKNDIRDLATPFRAPEDFDPILHQTRGRQFVAIGDASHGTHEFYRWRAELSKRLIEDEGFTWIGVEGDWPDCWRIDRWVRGLENQQLDARGLLAGFERWPTWLWANSDVADFLDWLHAWNASQHEDEKVGFYGLDVYSLWDSLDRIITWLGEHAPEAVPAALEAWQCFAPYNEDPHQYARSTRLVPQSCETDVVNLLVAVHAHTAGDGDGAFDAQQNAAIAVGAERYYRAMVRTDQESWNIRDFHMVDTIDHITRYLGRNSRGLIWEHNTHVGDARGTSMAAQGLVNVGQLLRQRYGDNEVFLVGFAGYRGHVLAGTQWGSPEQRMVVPPARARSHEALLHDTLGAPAVLDFGGDRTRPWLSTQRGHRAIGVVYDPDREAGNYVPTIMGRRYDALVWVETTTALQPLHHEQKPVEAEYETEPSGF